MSALRDNPTESLIERGKARRAEAVLLGLTFIWGGTFVVVKLALANGSAAEFLTLRFIIATLFFIVFFPKKSFALNKRLVRDAIILGLLSAGGYIFQTEGLKFTSASNSGFITGTSVVFTPLIQIALERRFPRWNQVLGVVIVCVGLYLLSGGTLGTLNYGDLLTLGCAIVFSFYIVWLDIVSPRHETIPLTMMQLLTSTVFFALLMPVMHGGALVLSGSLMLALLYTALLATVVTTFLQIKYQHFTTPVKAVLIFTAEPVFAAFFGHTVLGETLTTAGWTGAGLILGGVLVSEFIGNGRAEPNK